MLPVGKTVETVRERENVQNVKVEGHITDGETLCLEGIIERIAGDGSAIYGEENVFSIRRLPETHKVSKPAFNTAALIVIAARTLLVVFRSALKSIDVELPHIISDTVKILDQLRKSAHAVTSV